MLYSPWRNKFLGSAALGKLDAGKKSTCLRRPADSVHETDAERCIETDLEPLGGSDIAPLG